MPLRPVPRLLAAGCLVPLLTAGLAAAEGDAIVVQPTGEVDVYQPLRVHALAEVTSLRDVARGVLLRTDHNNNAAIELGVNDVATNPYIDWHISGNSLDYDARLIGMPGVAGLGGGRMQLEASRFDLRSHQADVPFTLNVGNFSGSSGPGYNAAVINLVDGDGSFWHLARRSEAGPENGALKLLYNDGSGYTSAWTSHQSGSLEVHGVLWASSTAQFKQQAYFDNDIVLSRTTNDNYIVQSQAAYDAGNAIIFGRQGGGNCHKVLVAADQGLETIGDFRVSGSSILRGHLYLYPHEGEGNSGTAYIQGRDVDDASTASIALQFRSQHNGSLKDSLRIDPTGSVRLKSGAYVEEFSTDSSLAGNSDSTVPTEKAVKTYVDSAVAGSTNANGLHTRVTNLLQNHGEATNGKRFVVAEVGYNSFHWQPGGMLIVELFSHSYGSEYKKYAIQLGYLDGTSNTEPTVTLVESIGKYNNTQVLLGPPTDMGSTSGGYPNQIRPIYVDVRPYFSVRARVTHTRTAVDTLTSQGQLVFHEFPVGTAIPDFTPSSDVVSQKRHVLAQGAASAKPITVTYPGTIASGSNNIANASFLADNGDGLTLAIDSNEIRQFGHGLYLSGESDVYIQTGDAADGTLNTQILANASGVRLRSEAYVQHFSTDGTLSDNSDVAVPTEKAVKTYVDTEVAKVTGEDPNRLLTGYREFEGSGDLTFCLGRFSEGITEVKVKILGGWAQIGGQFTISKQWGSSAPPVIVSVDAPSAVTDSLAFYYRNSENYSVDLWATWTNRSPDKALVNTVRCWVSHSGETLDLADFGDFSGTQLIPVATVFREDGVEVDVPMDITDDVDVLGDVTIDGLLEIFEDAIIDGELAVDTVISDNLDTQALDVVSKLTIDYFEMDVQVPVTINETLDVWHNAGFHGVVDFNDDVYVIGTLYHGALDPWPDYVFDPDYELMSLDDLRAFIGEHRHLPGMPSEEEVSERGYDMGKQIATQLEKIEELTLYALEADARLDAKDAAIAALQERAATAEAELAAMKQRLAAIEERLLAAPAVPAAGAKE